MQRTLGLRGFQASKRVETVSRLLPRRGSKSSKSCSRQVNNPCAQCRFGFGEEFANLQHLPLEGAGVDFLPKKFGALKDFPSIGDRVCYGFTGIGSVEEALAILKQHKKKSKGKKEKKQKKGKKAKKKKHSSSSSDS